MREKEMKEERKKEEERREEKKRKKEVLLIKNLDEGTLEVEVQQYLLMVGIEKEEIECYKEGRKTTAEIKPKNRRELEVMLEKIGKRRGNKELWKGLEVMVGEKKGGI